MRWLGRILLGLVLLLAVSLPALWLARDRVAAPAVKFIVNTVVGAPVVDALDFRVSGLRADRLTLEALSLNGDRGLSATRIHVDFDWRSLVRGRVETVALTHPVITIEIGADDTITLGGLEPFRSLGGNGSAPSGTALPAIRFTDAMVRIEGKASGRVDATGALWQTEEELRVAAEGRVSLTGADWRADGLAALKVARGPDRTAVDAEVSDAAARQGTLAATGLRGRVAAVLPTAALSTTDDWTLTADVTAERAQADDLDLADPSLHLRLGRLGISAVARLGSRDSPRLRLAVDTDRTVVGDRRPIVADLAADLATLDRLAAATRRTAPLGLTGTVAGTVRGSLPGDAGDPQTLWTGTVASGGMTLTAAMPGLEGTGRLGLALARGTLAIETLSPIEVAIEPANLVPDLTAAAGLDSAIGESVTARLGSPSESLSVLVEAPFQTPRLRLSGPLELRSEGGARILARPSATLVQSSSGWSVADASGRIEVRDVALTGGRIEALDMVIASFQATDDTATAAAIVTGRIDAGDVSGITLDMALRADHRNAETAVSLTRLARIEVAEGLAAGAVTAQGPVALQLGPSARPVLRYGGSDGSRLVVDLPMRIEDLAGRVIGDRPADVSVGELSGTVLATLRDGAGPVQLRLDGASLAIDPAARTETAAEAAPAAGVAINDIAIDAAAHVSDGAVSFERLSFTAARLSDRAPSPRFTALRAEGEIWQRGRPGLGFRSTLRGADGAFVLDAEGHHDLAAGTGMAEINLFPLVFVPGGLQPSDLSPATSALLRQASGRVALAGTLAWPGTAIAPHNPLTLAVEKLSFTGTLGTVSEMTGTVSLSSIDPLATPPAQEVRAAAIDVGVPIAEPRVTFRLNDAGSLTLERIRARFADGTVHADEVRIPLTSGDPIAVVLNVDGVDAERLASVTELEGLTASGSLSGRLPLVWDPAVGLSLQRARLAATTPGGTVRYRPAETPAALRDQGEEVSLLLQAVRNLVYERFEIEADGRPGEPFDVKLRVRGANPDLFDGYPVALNVSLSGRLDELFLNVRRTLGLGDILQRRLEAREPSG